MATIGLRRRRVAIVPEGDKARHAKCEEREETGCEGKRVPQSSGVKAVVTEGSAGPLSARSSSILHGMVAARALLAPEFRSWAAWVVSSAAFSSYYYY